MRQRRAAREGRRSGGLTLPETRCCSCPNFDRDAGGCLGRVQSLCVRVGAAGETVWRCKSLVYGAMGWVAGRSMHRSQRSVIAKPRGFFTKDTQHTTLTTAQPLTRTTSARARQAARQEGGSCIARASQPQPSSQEEGGALAASRSTPFKNPTRSTPPTPAHTHLHLHQHTRAASQHHGDAAFLVQGHGFVPAGARGPDRDH